MTSSSPFEEDDLIPWPPPPPPRTASARAAPPVPWRPPARTARPPPSPPRAPPTARRAVDGGPGAAAPLWEGGLANQDSLEDLLARLGLGKAGGGLPPLPDTFPSKRCREAGGAAAFEAAAAAPAFTSPVAPLRPPLCACCGRPKRARRQAAEGGPTAALPLPSPQSAPPAPPRHPAVARLLEEETAGVVAGAVAVATTARPSPLPRRAPTSSPGTPRPRRRVDRVIRYQEFQSAWAADPFLAVGGDDRHPHRPRGALAAAFAAEHAALAKAGWGA